MDLFNNQIEHPVNVLPYDGDVIYYGAILSGQQCDHYLAQLLDNIDWKHDEAIIYGKHITTKRKIAWYGDKPYQYTYSRTTKQALPWADELLVLKDSVEQASNATYNACLLNLYHDGSEGMSWHSDAEIDLKRHAPIASLSLGAERKFAFKHKATGEKVSVQLQHGSLLVMKGVTQEHWLHALPVTKKVDQPRVNLTFRTIFE